MRLIPISIILGVMLILVAACGDGNGAGGEEDGDDILHLRDADITSDNYRDYIRGEFLGSLRGICDGLQGLSTEEVLDAVLATQEGTPEPFEAPNVTPVADQEPDRDSRLAAAEIVREECERIGD